MLLVASVFMHSPGSWICSSAKASNITVAAMFVYQTTSTLQPLPYPFLQLRCSELPQLLQSLLGQVETFDRRHILLRRLADAGGDDDGVRLQHDAVVYNLVNGEGDQVVVFNDGPLVDGAPI